MCYVTCINTVIRLLFLFCKNKGEKKEDEYRKTYPDDFELLHVFLILQNLTQDFARVAKSHILLVKCTQKSYILCSNRE